MPNIWKSAKVGLFVVGISIAAWLIYRYIDERSGKGDSYEVWALFVDAQGLVPKSRVLIAGIPVGYIENVRLWKGKARVTVRIENDIALYKDARVRKESASILGESMLVIYPGSIDRPKLKDGDQILSAEESAGTDEVLENVNEIAKSIRLVAKQLERALGNDRAGDQMTGALEDVSKTLEGMRRIIEANESRVGNTLANVEQITSDAGPKVSRILDNIDDAMRNVQAIIGNNAEGLERAGGRVDNTMASIERASAKLEKVLDDIHEVTDRTAKGEGTVGRLTSDDKLIDDVEDVVEDVGDFVGGIARLQTIVGLRSEYNFLANSFKSYLSLRLQPREDRYFLIQLIDDPRGLTEQTQTTVRTSPPPADTPAFFQETRTVRRNAFRFSLMFAKRIYFATFRFGILESTGGVGTD